MAAYSYLRTPEMKLNTMREDAAGLYERGVEADCSAEEAWEQIQVRNEKTEWDIEAMLD
jgi:hypothetical protein